MTRRNATNHRYSSSDDRPFFLNEKHFQEALRIHSDFVKSIEEGSNQPEQDLDERIVLVRAGDLKFDEENKLLPVDGYLAFYSDLLGFTKEVSIASMGSLPDYFGGALFAASQHPAVKVYLLSDSCIATTPEENGDELIRFVTLVISQWLSNGLIPQCSIGYGSFVERKPFPRRRPSNFFGTQILGTALSDAVGLWKEEKPLGARVLVSEAARSRWPSNYTALVVPDGQGWEFLPERSSVEHLFDCIYYLLCLREHSPGTRPFDHYIWSFASRALAAGRRVPQQAARLVRPLLTDDCYSVAVREIGEVLETYEAVASPSSVAAVVDP